MGSDRFWTYGNIRGFVFIEQSLYPSFEVQQFVNQYASLTVLLPRFRLKPLNRTQQENSLAIHESAKSKILDADSNFSSNSNALDTVV